MNNPQVQARRGRALTRLQTKLDSPLATREDHQDSIEAEAATKRIQAEIETLKARGAVPVEGLTSA